MRSPPKSSAVINPAGERDTDGNLTAPPAELFPVLTTGDTL